MLRDEVEILKKNPAQGPEGLKLEVNNLLLKSQQDRKFASREHYIYYQHGNQESLIKVDMSEKPVLFWYFDLCGRPAPRNVRDCLVKNFNEKERYLEEISPQKIENYISFGLEGEKFEQGRRFTLEEVYEKLKDSRHSRKNTVPHAKDPKDEFTYKKKEDAPTKLIKSAQRLFSFFGMATKEKPTNPSTVKPTNSSTVTGVKNNKR